MTTEVFFTNSASNLELTKTERERVSKKHNGLRERLREKLSVEDDFLTGSYARNTLIKPKDPKEKYDVDFFLAFSKKDYGEKELSDLLKLVKMGLEKIEEEDSDIEDVKEQSRSLAVIYKDNFQIDVVPAIQIKKKVKYKIYDKTNREAVESNPRLHGANLTRANDKSESGSVKRLVPIVKLLKSWKRDKCDYLKSFHLEMLTIEILGGGEIKSYAEGIGEFFSSVEDYLEESCLEDPANEENVIDEYLDEDGNRDKILKLVRKEKKIAQKALELEESGKQEEAIKEWKKIFNIDKGSKKGKVVIKGTPSKPWCNVDYRDF